jgi:hypothetical protein
MRPKSAIAIPRSKNRKLGTCASTYAAQVTCPNDCPFLNSGCYAEVGNSYAGFTTNRLNQAARDEQRGALAVAREEARAIDTLSGELPLRLHVVGDCRTDAAARVVGKAAARYLRRWRRGDYEARNAEKQPSIVSGK